MTPLDTATLAHYRYLTRVAPHLVTPELEEIAKQIECHYQKETSYVRTTTDTSS